MYSVFYSNTHLLLLVFSHWENSDYTNVPNPITLQEEKLEQEPYSIVNLMARYNISEQLSAQVNIDNLLDKTYYSQIGTSTS